ncbi:hypothetical protein WJX81_003711 [Elliptochloris bilobata]|uniref:Glycosyltransferase n=1 Tax=Elliptochloris bilobata TaxID=381761 RepID=A0AAW1QNE1_9CHLO
MKLVFISLEFTAGTFSGNGVYAANQVRALAGLGHDVLVIAGKPPGHDKAPYASGACCILEVELPRWGRLDRPCAWQEFAAGAAELVQRMASFGARAALGVDWTSLAPYQQLADGLRRAGHSAPPYVFMNYRVHLRTAAEEDCAFIRSVEAEAATTAALMTVLSCSDAAYSLEHLAHPDRPALRPQVLFPALRMDLARIPLPADKDPLRFVEVVECLAAKGALERLQVTPLLLGSAQTPYAHQLRERFRAAAPGVRVEARFLGPDDMARIYAQTLLNLHPCLYDAFGMTVVEAASQGAPSVFNRGGAVGAGDLLSPARGEAIELDLAQPAGAIADELVGLLSDPASLATVAWLSSSGLSDVSITQHGWR